MEEPKTSDYLIQDVLYYPGVCDQGWSQNGLYCYYFSDVNATQPDAQALCEQEYATLVYLDDDGENIFCYQNGLV